ncbi:Plasmodium exported protein, unknown function [Plasmodium vivax]|uniref:Pv-fam-d protein n=4 Tax=Plasmodium vivax TaxID=5855 RepID=A0A1G4GYG2_PLAVI|nr:hypothetical protein PVIIG_04477 [Plasmodium vivax India VII]KMZ86468.1 hypothetical protein PVBG_05335 [Plasmodium vivax Brazil I]KMZ99355.1 hypothetical protein PVNG_04613 [Plasmodium vivax North Korean]CAI7720769.1 Plasmodium exported protein, unknown function [Plasmodium vivax]SCO67581.1 Plasmodium exported protein, unknown function [Plasmodium vivax]
MKNITSKFHFFGRILTLTLLVWTWKCSFYNFHLNVHSKAWDRRIIQNSILDVRASRLLRQKIDTHSRQSYSDVKEIISETFEEIDYRFAQGLNELEPEQNFGKNCNTLVRKGRFEKSCKKFNYDDNFKKSTSHFKISAITQGDDFCERHGALNNDDYFNRSTRPLKCNRSYQELGDVEEHTTGSKIGNTLKKRRHPKRAKFKRKVRKKQDFWILQFLKKVDLNFELDMLRFLNRNSSVNYYAVKHKCKFRKLLYFINRYKVFVPLLINFVMAVMLIVATSGTPGVRVAWQLVYAFILMLIYYYYKLGKLKRINYLNNCKKN